MIIALPVKHQVLQQDLNEFNFLLFCNLFVPLLYYTGSVFSHKSMTLISNKTDAKCCNIK